MVAARIHRKGNWMSKGGTMSRNGRPTSDMMMMKYSNILVKETQESAEKLQNSLETSFK